VRLDHISTAPRRHYETPNLVFGGSSWSEPRETIEDEKPVKRTVRSGPRGPGGTPRELARSGSGALTFDPQSKAELAQGEYKEQGKYWHDTYTQPGRGVARGGVLRTQRTTQPSWMLDVLF
jgi:hypothetical protein